MILHLDGNIRTVNNCNIKIGFLGLTIFGDSYKLGTVLVSKLIKVTQNNQQNEKIPFYRLHGVVVKRSSSIDTRAEKRPNASQRND